METLERNGYRTALLTEEEFKEFWPAIEKTLDKIPETWEDLTKDDIYQGVCYGNLQMWAVGEPGVAEMVLMTQIARYSAGSVLEIIWGAGEGKIFEKAGDSVDATMEYFAKTQHCKRIDVIGRGGWEKILMRRGFKRISVRISRNVIHNGMN